MSAYWLGQKGHLGRGEVLVLYRFGCFRFILILNFPVLQLFNCIAFRNRPTSLIV